MIEQPLDSDRIEKFRYWIQGYPRFYEPIAEEYFRVLGYAIIRRPAAVTRYDIQRLIGRLYDGVQPTGPEIDRQKLINALKK
jgi:hypothetical protein